MPKTINELDPSGSRYGQKCDGLVELSFFALRPCGLACSFAYYKTYNLKPKVLAYKLREYNEEDRWALQNNKKIFLIIKTGKCCYYLIGRLDNLDGNILKYKFKIIIKMHSIGY